MRMIKRADYKIPLLHKIMYCPLIYWLIFCLFDYIIASIICTDFQ